MSKIWKVGKKIKYEGIEDAAVGPTRFGKVWRGSLEKISVDGLT